MHTAAQVIVVVLLLPVSALTVVRVLGLDLGHPWPALLTVFPWVALVGAAALGLATAVGWWPAIGLGGLVSLVGGAALLPRVIPRSSPPTPSGPSLTVMVANLRVGHGDPAAVTAAVRTHGVDVLVTLELTGSAIDALRGAGLGDVLPNTTLRPGDRMSGGGIHSRLPLTTLPPRERHLVGRSPRASLELADGRCVVVEGVHPLPPIDADWTGRWRATLAGLDDPPGGGAQVLAGDFNATLDHVAFRALLAAGWVDAADSVGAGLRPTFNGLRWGDPVPPVTLDHVLVDEDTLIERVLVLPLAGSDHRMVVARLRLPVASGEISTA